MPPKKQIPAEEQSPRQRADQRYRETEEGKQTKQNYNQQHYKSNAAEINAAKREKYQQQKEEEKIKEKEDATKIKVLEDLENSKVELNHQHGLCHPSERKSLQNKVQKRREQILENFHVDNKRHSVQQQLTKCLSSEEVKKFVHSIQEEIRDLSLSALQNLERARFVGEDETSLTEEEEWIKRSYDELTSENNNYLYKSGQHVLTVNPYNIYFHRGAKQDKVVPSHMYENVVAEPVAETPNKLELLIAGPPVHALPFFYNRETGRSIFLVWVQVQTFGSPVHQWYPGIYVSTTLDGRGYRICVSNSSFFENKNNNKNKNNSDNIIITYDWDNFNTNDDRLLNNRGTQMFFSQLCNYMESNGFENVERITESNLLESLKMKQCTQFCNRYNEVPTSLETAVAKASPLFRNPQVMYDVYLVWYTDRATQDKIPAVLLGYLDETKTSLVVGLYSENFGDLQKMRTNNTLKVTTSFEMIERDDPLLNNKKNRHANKYYKFLQFFADIESGICTFQEKLEQVRLSKQQEKRKEDTIYNNHLHVCKMSAQSPYQMDKIPTKVLDEECCHLQTENLGAALGEFPKTRANVNVRAAATAKKEFSQRMSQIKICACCGQRKTSPLFHQLPTQFFRKKNPYVIGGGMPEIPAVYLELDQMDLAGQTRYVGEVMSLPETELKKEDIFKHHQDRLFPMCSERGGIFIQDPITNLFYHIRLFRKGVTFVNPGNRKVHPCRMQSATCCDSCMVRLLSAKPKFEEHETCDFGTWENIICAPSFTKGEELLLNPLEIMSYFIQHNESFENLSLKGHITTFSKTTVADTKHQIKQQINEEKKFGVEAQAGEENDQTEKPSLKDRFVVHYYPHPKSDSEYSKANFTKSKSK